jgi:CRISPR/Cas system-associated exonuclease Cas4 (RecB family)
MARKAAGPKPDKKISPSQINSFFDCPCCFYLDRNKVSKRPRGIFAGLPIGIDKVFRNHYRGHAAAGTLPSEVTASAFFNAKWKLVQDDTLVSKEQRVDPSDWHNANGVDYALAGKMDEMLEDPTGNLVVVDFKTKASKNSSDKGPHPTAVRQMALYALIMESQGRQAGDVAYLAHLFPTEANDGPIVPFGCDFYEIDVGPAARAAASQWFHDAADCIEGAQPAKNPDCEHCNYRA